MTIKQKRNRSNQDDDPNDDDKKHDLLRDAKMLHGALPEYAAGARWAFSSPIEATFRAVMSH